MARPIAGSRRERRAVNAAPEALAQHARDQRQAAATPDGVDPCHLVEPVVFTWRTEERTHDVDGPLYEWGSPLVEFGDRDHDLVITDVEGEALALWRDALLRVATGVEQGCARKRCQRA